MGRDHGDIHNKYKSLVQDIVGRPLDICFALSNKKPFPIWIFINFLRLLLQVVNLALLLNNTCTIIMLFLRTHNWIKSFLLNFGNKIFQIWNIFSTFNFLVLSTRRWNQKIYKFLDTFVCLKALSLSHKKLFILMLDGLSYHQSPTDDSLLPSENSYQHCLELCLNYHHFAF